MSQKDHLAAVDAACLMITVRSSRHRPGGGYLPPDERRRPMKRAELIREAVRYLLAALKAGRYRPTKHRAGEAEILLVELSGD